jgi:hypothetical protein
MDIEADGMHLAERENSFPRELRSNYRRRARDSSLGRATDLHSRVPLDSSTGRSRCVACIMILIIKNEIKQTDLPGSRVQLHHFSLAK